MRVVLIAYHFPPDPSVGSVRAGKVAAAFAAAGHDVHVIAPRLAGEAAPPLAGVVVHRIAVLPNVREIRAAVKRRLGRRREAGASAAGEVRDGRTRSSRRGAGLKRHVLSLLFLPDDRAGFIVPAVRCARRLSRQVPTLLYTTGPPFSSHVAGMLLRRFTSASWVAEYRDPWILPHQPELRSWLADAIHRRMRRRCLLRADAVVAVSEALARELTRTRQAAGSSPAVLVRNGIDFVNGARMRASSANGEDGEVFRIGYFGHVYLGRDPRPFLRGLARLRSEGRLPRAVRVEMYGDCRYYYDVSIQEEAVRLGIRDCLSFHHDLPRAECLQVMASCDLLLLLAQKQPTQVPNKLYDYLGTGRPIFAFADADGESARMLQMLGRDTIVTSGDDAAVAEALLRAMSAHGAIDAAARAVLEEWSTETQMKRLVEFVGTLPEPGGRR